MSHFVAIHSVKNAAGFDQVVQSDSFPTRAEAEAQLAIWKANYPSDDFTVMPCSMKCGGHKFQNLSLKA